MNEENRRDRLTVTEVADKDVSEESPTGDATDALNTSGLQRVHGIEEGSEGETGRPNHRRGIDEETLADTTDGVTNQLGRHDQKPLVYVNELSPIVEAQTTPQLTYKCRILVVEDLLDGDNICLKSDLREHVFCQSSYLQHKQVQRRPKT